MLDNLELAAAGYRGVFPALFFRVSGEQRQQVDEVLGIVSLGRHRHRPAHCPTDRSNGWKSACY